MASMATSPTHSNGPYQPQPPQMMHHAPGMSQMSQGPPQMNMNSPPRAPPTITPQSHVGFDTITQQIERKLLKRGFQFNVICVGMFVLKAYAATSLMPLQVKADWANPHSSTPSLHHNSYNQKVVLHLKKSSAAPLKSQTPRT